MRRPSCHRISLLSFEFASIVQDVKGSGEPLVLIHGAFADARIWAPNLDELSQRFQVITVSLPGAFRSQDSGDHSAEEHVAAIADLIDSMPEGAHVLGHSRGGRIAFHLAAMRPQGVRGLVLVEPGGAMEPSFSELIDGSPASGGEWAKSARDGALNLLEAGEFEAAAKHYIDSMQGAGQWDQAPRLFRDVAIDNIATLKWIAKDSSTAFSIDAAKRIIVPTLILVGTESPPIFKQIGGVLFKLIPSSVRERIDGGGHLLPLTHASEFAQRVSRFLYQQPSNQ